MRGRILRKPITSALEILRHHDAALIAHRYNLTEAELAHILTTSPLVAEPVKVAALNAYRDVERGLVK